MLRELIRKDGAVFNAALFVSMVVCDTKWFLRSGKL